LWGRHPAAGLGVEHTLGTRQHWPCRIPVGRPQPIAANAQCAAVETKAAAQGGAGSPILGFAPWAMR
jgi:hypothetical protein